VDGFILTHAYDQVEFSTQQEVDAYLPPYEPRQVLDPDNPVNIGAMVGPEAFTEVRYLSHHKQLRALERIPALGKQFQASFGRGCGGLVRPYRSEDAETLVIALGSVNGTIQDVVDEMRDAGHSIGSLSIGCFRPFPLDALRQAIGNAARVLVVEKSLAPGIGGVVSTDVRTALAGKDCRIFTAIAGLGGRAITKASLRNLFENATRDTLEELTFLDLHTDLIERHLQREQAQWRTGPAAENILYDIQLIAAEIG
jgi:pyruvate ferredoxin oxidoreductase alpha subunit